MAKTFFCHKIRQTMNISNRLLIVTLILLLKIGSRAYAQEGEPGQPSTETTRSTPRLHYLEKPIFVDLNNQSNFMILDKKQNLLMKSNKISFESLTNELIIDTRVNDLERCVIFLQMFTYVGDDIYEENINKFKNNCNRDESEKFIIENASYIEY